VIPERRAAGGYAKSPEFFSRFSARATLLSTLGTFQSPLAHEHTKLLIAAAHCFNPPVYYSSDR
jgi:hypothetical protein